MKDLTKTKIKDLVQNVIEAKLNKYSAETDYKPFFEALFGEAVIIQTSILHSFYTSFGMSVYEPIAKILAENAGYEAQTQYDLLGEIDSQTENMINELCHSNAPPNKVREIEKIREFIKQGKSKKDKDSRVDIFIYKPNTDEELYIDITTAKPNKKEFGALRRKMLRWCGLRFSQHRKAKIKTYIAIPYNPYHPHSYARWTANECDVQNELLIQENFWNECAGEGVYEDLLNIFREVGVEMKSKIDQWIKSKSK
ncbi:MAG: TdeIII family type II restriction endonuclease [Okeania sp. SIO2C9]|uniref:TdeIII family type II restriction endonuclease n=1 Tax=Okeania sp. SIO2C9 TaxID=2607791 RepID=UPI0013C0298F|nr:TdeIII family type II restriction endonuclease [Okeania sp. SIO2C9]NEQ78030.1 TdeIII family type II restriction endonuclease [Okeania sp. SIO2C9]